MQIKKHFKMNHVFFIQTRMVFKFLMINRRPLVLYISFFITKNFSIWKYSLHNQIFKFKYTFAFYL